jgi:hypothetical protein
LIDVVAIPQEENETISLPQVTKEFNAISTPTTIQQAFYDGGILQLHHLTWSKLRDLLTDVNHLFPDFQYDHLDQLSPHLCHRDDYLKKFTRGVKIHLRQHTYSTSIPLPRFSITLQIQQTHQSYDNNNNNQQNTQHNNSKSYTLLASNKFVMWKMVCEIRRRFSFVERQNDNFSEGRSELWFNQMYSRYYWPELENPIFHPLTLQVNYYSHTHGVFQSCECSLTSDEVVIIISDELIRIPIQDIESLLVGGEFTSHQPYDLRVDLISGQIDLQTFTEAQNRTKLLTERYQELSGHTKENKQFLKIFHTLKKNLLTSSSNNNESSTLYVDLLGGSFICTNMMTGFSPIWNTSTLLKINEQILLSSNLNFSSFEQQNENNDPTSVGIMFHLVSSQNSSCVLGSKFVKFSDLISSSQYDKLSQKNILVQDSDLTIPGRTKSLVQDHTIELDQDVAIRVDVLNAIGLPPHKEFKIICSFVKFDGNIRKKYSQYSYV